MSDEETLFEALRLLEISRYTFHGNYWELRKALEWLSAPPQSIVLMQPSNATELDKHLREIARRLQNFVASVKALVDHTRLLYEKHYEPGATFLDYKDRVKLDFVDSLVSKFLEDLRNYIFHYRSANPVHQLSMTVIDGEQVTTSVTMIKVSDLMRNRSWWKENSIKYMDGKETIDILEAISEYHTMASAFHSWFEQRTRELMLNSAT